MDQRLQNIIDNFDSMKIGLDDTFQFSCRQCGQCCIHREDIMLNAKDMYNLSKALSLTPKQVVERYCEVYIGHDSRIPIVRLKPQGHVHRCPLLKDRRCSVHSLKPTVCAMFPIGRCIQIDPDDTDRKDIRRYGTVYINNHADCGSKTERHTVREWLTMFGIPAEDEFFYAWQQTILDVSAFVHKVESKLSKEIMAQIWSLIYVILYLCYDSAEEFMPQFLSNSHKLRTALDELPLEL